MSFKKAFKAIFSSYERGPIRIKYLEKLARREKVNLFKLEKAVIDKGIDLIP